MSYNWLTAWHLRLTEVIAGEFGVLFLEDFEVQDAVFGRVSKYVTGCMWIQDAKSHGFRCFKGSSSFLTTFKKHSPKNTLPWTGPFRFGNDVGRAAQSFASAAGRQLGSRSVLEIRIICHHFSTRLPDQLTPKSTSA